MQTGDSRVAALRNQTVRLFSDLLIHDMGVGLADGVSQGEAGPREFRTAPLWEHQRLTPCIELGANIPLVSRDCATGAMKFRVFQV